MQRRDDNKYEKFNYDDHRDMSSPQGGSEHDEDNSKNSQSERPNDDDSQNRKNEKDTLTANMPFSGKFKQTSPENRLGNRTFSSNSAGQMIPPIGGTFRSMSVPIPNATKGSSLNENEAPKKAASSGQFVPLKYPSTSWQSTQEDRSKQSHEISTLGSSPHDSFSETYNWNQTTKYRSVNILEYLGRPQNGRPNESTQEKEGSLDGARVGLTKETGNSDTNLIDIPQNQLEMLDERIPESNVDDPGCESRFETEDIGNVKNSISPNEQYTSIPVELQLPKSWFLNSGLAEVKKLVEADKIIPSSKIPKLPSFPELATASLRGSLVDIVLSITKSLASRDVTLKFINSEISWRCYVVLDLQKLDFQVSLYRNTVGYSLQFHRYEGSAMHFFSLFRAVLDDLAHQQLVIDDNGDCVPPANTDGSRLEVRVSDLPPLPEDPFANTTMKSEMFKPLYLLASCPDENASFSALKGIAEHASHESRRDAIGMLDGLVKLLLKYISTASSRLRRPSCYIISELSKSATIRSQIIQEQGIQILLNALLSQRSLDRETAQMVTSVLVLLVPENPTTIKSDEYKMFFTQLTSTEGIDPIIARNAETLLTYTA